MNDLSEIAGIGLHLTADHKLVFGEEMNAMVESVRQVKSLDAVWKDASVSEQRHADDDIYRVYWGSYRTSEKAAFAQYGLDHAYVVLFPGTYGGEYNKTQGHYHPPLPGTNTSTPELYKVLHGHGCFLLQRSSPPYDQIEDVVLVETQPGDVFHVAPNYGHLTINWGDEPLVFEAFLSTDVTPITAPYRARRGGTHYVMRGDASENAAQAQVVANDAYTGLPKLRRCASGELERWETQWGNLYQAVAAHPEKFSFLVNPSNFDPAWTL